MRGHGKGLGHEGFKRIALLEIIDRSIAEDLRHETPEGSRYVELLNCASLLLTYHNHNPISIQFFNSIEDLFTRISNPLSLLRGKFESGKRFRRFVYERVL